MSSTEEKSGAPPDADAWKQGAFAKALGAELDRIGYPEPPARTNQLAQDLGFTRMQAFRLSRGDNLPSVRAMLALQRLGVSLDAVLDELQESRPEEIAVEVQGVNVRAVPTPAFGRTAFVIAKKGRDRTLRALGPLEPLDGRSVPVGGLRFVRPQSQPTVAVIEDDAPTLKVLCAELEQSFNVVPFQDEKTFLKGTKVLSRYDAIVLDWVLPAIDGATVVESIRAHNQAPIVVITGHRKEAAAISEVLSLPDLYYAAKPIDGNILRAMVSAAISKMSGSPPKQKGAR